MKNNLKELQLVEPSSIFKEGDFYSEESYNLVSKESKIEDKHERMGYEFFKIKKYFPLLRVDNKIHGFDGVFIKNDEIFFYEAKYRTNESLLEIWRSAIKTNTGAFKGRFSPTGDNLDKVKTLRKTGLAITDGKEYVSKNKEKILKIEKRLNEILGQIKDTKIKKINLLEQEMLLNLGGKNLKNKNYDKHIKNLKNHNFSLVVHYEK